MSDGAKKALKIAFLIGIPLLWLISSYDSGYEERDSRVGHDWNDEEDVQDFIEWKEENGSGWSNN